jgi:sugar lactone lactonase YvrE
MMFQKRFVREFAATLLASSIAVAGAQAQIATTTTSSTSSVGCLVAQAEMAPGGSTPAQTLYVATQNNIYLYSLGATTPRLTISQGLTGVTQIAIDRAGRVYASNFGEPIAYANTSVTEYLVGETSPVLTRTNGASSATGVAVDYCGNVYASEYYAGAVSVYHAAQVNPFMQVAIGTPQQLAIHGHELFVEVNNPAVADQGEILVYPTGSVLTVTAPGPLPQNALTSVGPFVVGIGGSVYAGGAVIANDVGFEEFVDVFAPGHTSPRTSVVVSTGRNAGIPPSVFVAGASLYVSAADINTVFQYKIGWTLQLVRTITADLNQPGSMAVDAQQNLYVLNAGGEVTVYPPDQITPSQIINLPIPGTAVAVAVK